MLHPLQRLLVRQGEDPKTPAVRERCGSVSSLIGIFCNLLLFAIKLLAGTLCGSLAIRADAINNLSDAGSSAISLVSFKLSAKPPDRHHPFGHARIEYVASMAVSFFILLIGVELVKGAIEKLMAPTPPLFHAVAVIILAVSILLKLALALFNFRVGRMIDSPVLRATATDSLSDALSTAAVLLATVLSPLLPAKAAVLVDPIMSILVATLIFVAGIRILNDTKNSILGTGPAEETVATIRSVVAEYPEALGIHDLVVHHYGTGHMHASLHIEVDGKKDIFASHDAIDLIERRLQEEHNIICSIHLDPIVTDDPVLDEWHARLCALATALDTRLQIHDFRMVPGNTHTNLIFDVAAPFEVKLSDEEIKLALAEAVATEAPCFFTVITIDRV